MAIQSSMDDLAIDNTRAEELLRQGGRAMRTNVPTGLPGQSQTIETPIVTQTSLQPAVDLQKAKVQEPIPGFGRFRESSPGQTSGLGDAIGLNAPPAGGPPVQDEKANQLAMLDQLYAQYQGMRGAPTVRMNQDIREGIAGQQRAARGVLEAIGAEEPGQQAARAGMMAEGQRYIAGLQKLRGEQEQLFGARRAAMAEDEARMAQAEKSFDASRVIREVGNSPLSTGALSFAAGLVGALKGQAGDMGPNQILAAVGNAIKRNVMNQEPE